MPIKVLMPALSPTMEEGGLSKWLKKEGESVMSGEPIAEIETDKATMEVEAQEDGVLGKILVPEGSENVPVSAVIALLLEEGEDPSVLEGVEVAKPAPREAKAPEAAAAPSAPAEEEEEPAAAAEPSRGEKAAPPKAEPARPPPEEAAAPRAARGPGEGARVPASPLARRMAAQAGLELARIEGSGPHGRVVKADIEAALAQRAVPEARPTPPPAAAPAAEYTEIPHSKIRRIVAKRLLEAKQTVPHFYLTIDCEIDPLLELRDRLNAKSEDYKLTLNDFIVRAAALALRRVPMVNAVWTEDAIRRYTTVDISVAVAIKDGLVTPIVRNADQKGLAEISNELRELISRARAQPMGLSPEEYQGGTFTVSNLGMYSIRDFAAVINPPQACILAVGTGEKRPVVKEGALAIATQMTCTLSCDHRVVDGALGAAFLEAFKGLIEDPLTMLL